MGANIGVYTRFLSEAVGPMGSVWSLEPVPFTFRVLQENVKALTLRNVRAMRVAASEIDGTATIDIPKDPGGQPNVYLARIGGHSGDGERASVSTRSLDSLPSTAHRVPALIKIDVEGHEVQCIHGARITLERYRPALQIEVSGDPDVPDTSAESLFHELIELQYQCYRWDGSSFRLREAFDKSVNYFFLQDDHFRQHKTRDD